jgi:hypothetical protein
MKKPPRKSDDVLINAWVFFRYMVLFSTFWEVGMPPSIWECADKISFFWDLVTLGLHPVQFAVFIHRTAFAQVRFACALPVAKQLHLTFIYFLSIYLSISCSFWYQF